MLSPVTDVQGSAADADDGRGRLDRNRALVAQLAADILQRTLRQFGQHMAAVGSGIVDEFVDHQAGIRRDIERAPVQKQKLHGSGGRGVDAFFVHDARADGEHRGRAAGRRTFCRRIDRGRGADLLRHGRRRHGENGRERQDDGFEFPNHGSPQIRSPQNLIKGPALTDRSRYENAATFDVAFRYCSSEANMNWRQIGTS